MAATISVNFATVEEVFSVQPPLKKSISARVLSDALGGGQIGGGYVRRAGDVMKGYLTLRQSPPLEPYHAVTKKYVDDHAFTRRYRYEVSDASIYGALPVNSVYLSGIDINANNLYFYERDDMSVQNIFESIDVFRNGILQTYGAFPNDFRIINLPGFANFAGISAIEFYQPFKLGETFQVNIGNIGAYPVTFGVERLYGEFGIVTNRLSGDCTLNITPSSFVSTDSEVNNRSYPYSFLTPMNLSAYPLIVRAGGLISKSDSYSREAVTDEISNPNPKYGNTDGTFNSLCASNIEWVKSGVNNNPPTRISVALTPGTFDDNNYSAIVQIYNIGAVPDNYVFANVINDASKTRNGFDFFIFDFFLLPPQEIYQLSILVY